MRLAGCIAAVLVLGPVAGCVTGPGPDETTGERGVELGTGSWRFEPVDDGDQLDLVRGAQGGWHLWVSLRTQGISEDRTTLIVETQLADDSASPIRHERTVRLDPPDDEGRRAVVGWQNIIPDPSCMVGQMVRMEATLMDDTGEPLTSERYVVPMGGAYPPPPCDTGDEGEI